MFSRDGRYVLIFNGEVYNYLDIRPRLEARGIHFRSTGDAEVVLYALAEWGTKALGFCNGMFALSFYDTVEKRMLLARDHAGIKPLYYMQTSDGIVFASQYDQILSHPRSRDLEISEDALALYLRLGYIPAPYAILEKTSMLEQGSWLEIDNSGHIKKGRFYEFPVYQEADLFGKEAYEAVDAAITAAVQRHMISDVPVGTFLSGGIDSPLVSSKIKAIAKEPVRAFTIGTNGDELDESPDARIFAQQLGLEHTVEHATPAQALEMLDDVVSACGEPFADYSIFPTMLVSKLARKYVKVVLSGDGGDELFWGYAGRFSLVMGIASEFAQPQWYRTARWSVKRVLNVGKGHHRLRWNDIGTWYRAKHSRLSEGMLGGIFPSLPEWPAEMQLFSYSHHDASRTAQWLRWNEFVGHLAMVLLKVDRASMYHSLEVRVPLLDREVLNVAARVDWKSCLNAEEKIGKLPLRYCLSKHVQHQKQTKRGFRVPMDSWLRGPLRSTFRGSCSWEEGTAGITDRKRVFEENV